MILLALWTEIICVLLLCKACICHCDVTVFSALLVQCCVCLSVVVVVVCNVMYCG